MVYQLEKLLKDNANKIGESDKRADPVGHRKGQARRRRPTTSPHLRQAVASWNRRRTPWRSTCTSRAPAAAAGGPEAGTAPNGDGKGGKEDVIDAEFEVKK